MAKYIKYLGLALIIIPAFVIIAGSFLGWQDFNILNLSMFICMVAGIITYIMANKQAIIDERNSKVGFSDNNIAPPTFSEETRIGE
jgi:uncharacterized membrane protein